MAETDNDLATTVSTLLRGATREIALKARWDEPSEFGLPLDQIATMTDRRVRRRCLLPLPTEDRLATDRGATVRHLRTVVDRFIGTGWDVRLVAEPHMLVSSLLVDEG